MMAICGIRVQVRRFDCSFILIVPTQTSAGKRALFVVSCGGTDYATVAAGIPRYASTVERTAHELAPSNWQYLRTVKGPQLLGHRSRRGSEGQRCLRGDSRSRSFVESDLKTPIGRIRQFGNAWLHKLGRRTALDMGLAQATPLLHRPLRLDGAGMGRPGESSGHSLSNVQFAGKILF
jgi:hypothetical protein